MWLLDRRNVAWVATVKSIGQQVMSQNMGKCENSCLLINPRFTRDKSSKWTTIIFADAVK